MTGLEGEIVACALISLQMSCSLCRGCAAKASEPTPECPGSGTTSTSSPSLAAPSAGEARKGSFKAETAVTRFVGSNLKRFETSSMAWSEEDWVRDGFVCFFALVGQSRMLDCLR